MTTLESETLPARPPAAPDRAETGCNVLDLVADLPARQQEVLRLKFHAGLSYREIATVLDLTVSHVGVLIHNSIKSIREHAAALGEPAPRPAPSNVSVTG
jgi:RNA polymerase sigma-70 factor (ECF subfamily)